MDGWMDGGVLIRYLGKWMTFRRVLGLGFQGGVRCGELRVRWGVGKKLRTRMLTLIFVFQCDFLRFWRDLGSILGGFGRLQWT